MLNLTQQVDVFPWETNFETGIEIVDLQHRQLVDFVNRLAAGLIFDPGALVLTHLLDEAAGYVEHHFHTEASIWGPTFSGDEWWGDHLANYDTFMDKVAGFRERLDTVSQDALLDEFLRFLIVWLAHHIFAGDMRMAGVVRGLEQGIPWEQAKAAVVRDMRGSCEDLMEAVLAIYADMSSRVMEMIREQTTSLDTLARNIGVDPDPEHIFSEAVVANVPGLLYLFDDEFRLRRWNQRFGHESGYSDVDLKGKYVLDFFAERQHAAVMETITLLLKGESVEIEGKLLSRDGLETPYLFTGTPLSLGGRHCFFGIAINIAQLKEAKQELRMRSEESHQALLGTVTAVSRAMEARDPYTNGHQQRTSNLAVAIAERLGLDAYRIEGLRLGAGVHDIGKLGVPVDLLVKPTRLTACEYGVVKTHVEAGTEILKEVQFPWPILDIVSQHHERLDGSGYPLGLKGDDICLEARIVAVADVYEAMSAHRPYRSALGEDAALKELMRNRGVLYDPNVVDALKALIEEDRTGLLDRIEGRNRS